MSAHPDPARADAIKAAVQALAAKLDIESTREPWTQWLAQVPRWPSTPLDAWLEHDVAELIAASDRRRLAVKPVTKRFAAMWADIRRAHEDGEYSAANRCQRFMAWRALALKVIYERDQFQDDIDRALCREKLAEALAIFYPTTEPELRHHRLCPERANFTELGDMEPFAAYVAVMFMLVRAEADTRSRRAA